MMSEMKKNKISYLCSRGQSTACEKNVSKQISSHCENSAQTLPQTTDAEIPKQTGHTKVIDDDKQIRVKINLHRLTSQIVCDILNKSKPATRGLIGTKESDTMYGAAHSGVQRKSYDQKSMAGNDVTKLNKNMPEIKKIIKENLCTSSQSAFDVSSELLSEELRDLLGDSIANEDILATFSFENNDAEINNGHKQILEQCNKKICRPFYYNKTSKRNKSNLCWTRPSLECNISDMVEPKVAEGIVDRNMQTVVIRTVPPNDKKTPRRDRLTYKVQYRISLDAKIYPNKSDKTNEVVSQLKQKPVLPISPVTKPKSKPALPISPVTKLKPKPALPISPVSYEYERFLSHGETVYKRIKLSFTKLPPNFLIPINTTVDDWRYTEKCIVERITFEKITVHTPESRIDNSNEKLHYEVPTNRDTFVEKEIDVNIKKQRKRCSTEDKPCKTKRKCIPQIDHDIKNKNQELKHSMRTKKDLLKTNDDDRIVTSRNKPIRTIQKHQEIASLSQRVNDDLTQNAKFSREIETLPKNMPWDFALRTAMPATVELDKVGMSKSSETLTNEITIPEVVDEEKDHVLHTQNALKTLTSDHSDCTMITVSETSVIENDVGEMVKKECNTESDENILSMPDIEVDDYKTEIDDDVESCSDDEFLYPLPREGSIWQITMDDSGAVIYENIRPGDTDAESANEESESENKQAENQLTYKETKNDEFPILHTIKSSDSDAETEKYEEEENTENDVELNAIDEEKITIYELKTELCDEENSPEIDVSNEEKKPIFEIPFFDDDNTVELDIASLSNIKKHGEFNSGAEVVDKGQIVDTDVQSDLLKQEVSRKMHAESRSYNEEQTNELNCKMNNNNEIRDNPAEETKINNNSEHDKIVNSSPIRNQNELNFQINPENQNLFESTIPEIRRTSATTFEIRFNDVQQTTPSNNQPEVVLENVVKEININVSSYAQKKEGKIIILEDKIVKLNASGVPSENQKNIDGQSMSMVLQNATEQTEGQSVTKNDDQSLTTVPQQQVTREIQHSLIKQFQQPDTREFPQPRQPVIEERRLPVSAEPQELVTTQPQLPVTIASSGILQAVLNNQNTSTYPVPVIATNVIIQNVTENQMPRVPLQMAGVPVSISYMSGYTQNYNEMHQRLNSQIPSISTVQATQRSETGELNHTLPNPYTAQNVQHQQNGPIAEGNHGETIKVISLTDKDIEVRQYNEKQVSHVPSPAINLVKHNLYQNPVAQHINQMPMLPNNYPRPIESARSFVTVNQHRGNRVGQMPYQGHNMVPQYSNQHFEVPQNRQMPNNQTEQRGQHQPCESSSYKEMNVPRMDLPRTSMVPQQINRPQVAINHQFIPEPTRNRLIQSIPSDQMLPMSNNGGTIGANGINMNQNPPIQHVNNPYAVVPYRNVHNLPSRNSPVQHNGVAINNNNNNIHSNQPSVQNHPTYLPPPYQGHMQYNTQTLPNNNMEHSSQSLQIMHQNYVNTNLYVHMMEQQSQLRAMKMKIEELNEALNKQTANTPRRGRKKKDDNDEAISPVVPNNSQERVLENAGPQVMSIRMPSEDPDLTYRNNIARNDSQQAGPVPYIPIEEHRLAYRNHLARNNSQQVGSMPMYLNRAPVTDSQQEFPVPRVPPKEHYVKYRNRPVWKDSHEVSSTPLVSPEESSTKYPNRSLGINSQQVRPVTRTHFEEQNLKYTNRPPGMNSQHVRPVPLLNFDPQYLQYANRPPVQQGTQERYPLTPAQSAGLAQNVIPAPSKNVYYPKPEVPRSQNVSMVQPSVPLATPSQSRHQPQESQPASIYNRPVRNEDAAKLQNLHADKMHAQAAQNNYSVNQLSNEDGPINLSIHHQNERNKPQQDNNVSDQDRNEYYRTGSEYMELEALRKHLEKKRDAAPRNKSRDSGYMGSPEEGRS